MAPQAPPTELVQLSALVRYVRLLPFLEDVATSLGAKEDVWTATHEVLHMGAGEARRSERPAACGVLRPAPNCS